MLLFCLYCCWCLIYVVVGVLRVVVQRFFNTISNLVNVSVCFSCRGNFLLMFVVVYVFFVVVVDDSDIVYFG